MITTSGMFYQPALMCAYLALGADNILFAIDYPYEATADGVKFIEEAPISDVDKEKICHVNTERIFKLK
jgi:predicted TIM-barrel fold metal-dependent hydrolase